ncbi:ribonuclease HI [Neorhodopirellula lusitana]
MTQSKRHRNPPTAGDPAFAAMRHLATAQEAISNAMDDDVVVSPPSDNLASLLLVVSAQSTTLTDGRWQFAIETADGQPVLEADDCEPGDLNRLTLLAAVRGLESIDGSSSVTLLSHNRYLIRSLTDSLPRWRRSDFVWDHFGRRVEVQHADLWRRIDRTLEIHEVQACLLTARVVSRTSDRPIAPMNIEESRSPDSARWGDNTGSDSSSQLRVDPAQPGISSPPNLARSGNSATHHASLSSNGSINGPLKGTNRLRDWVLRSAVDTSHRAQQIAMMRQRVDNRSNR